jgi:hypothetical protein
MHNPKSTVKRNRIIKTLKLYDCFLLDCIVAGKIHIPFLYNTIILQLDK